MSLAPATGDKKFCKPKKVDPRGVFEIKKLFSSGTLKEKEIKLGPHRGSPSG